ncbi:glutamine synthetase family protein [Maritalea mediterranea]|uniref:Glutamine synthetase family protein n=1 Tax=Maritalea mediterranea TaxID=2909667 RepID=A0ABS9E7U6_9HYPH|nr:glutamine synthetase family protein [Maritalea mediterranea]MCF4097516.1 glutamine synthetase family protein [Maritalea mediterranea]
MSQLHAQDWLAENPDIDAVMVALCDLNGVLRGKRVPRAQISKILDGGMRMPLSACAVDIWGRDVEESELVFTSGDADGVCLATERGLIPRPWLNNATPMLQISVLADDGSPFGTDCRMALANIVKRFKAKGLTPVVATEMEFYLTQIVDGTPQTLTLPQSHRPIDKHNVLAVSELDALGAFLDDVYGACAKLDIPADAAISESGSGQFEINLLHSAEPLRAADDALLFKELVKGVARQHGFSATFMAKPFGDQAGNGMHVHFSLLDENGNNVFDDGTNEGGDILRFAVSGLLGAMQESTLIYAPHLNSYRRIRPGQHAPIGVAWGYENRTCAIRIPGGPGEARRIEQRVAGADANPYLVIAAILGAALNGIEAKTLPDPPLTGNAYAADTQVLPTEFGSAIDAFANGQEIVKIFDPQLVRLFAQTKQQERNRFLDWVTEGEYAAYLETV